MTTEGRSESRHSLPNLSAPALQRMTAQTCLPSRSTVALQSQSEPAYHCVVLSSHQMIREGQAGGARDPASQGARVERRRKLALSENET